ncbi:two-on-two hemoglobin-3 [Phalaenopsis equestris]|uniref:two-on-two hemoglobin-3 n=1 Tax=Phalaenopsis equestris TaxID=78828 RepID=UPI0009E3901A|nr:two-on-two hemoglobin-3 [Phalaenopsis equestris]
MLSFSSNIHTLWRGLHARSLIYIESSTSQNHRSPAAGEMQSLQEKASEWSGVLESDAFAIDETNLFNALGGGIKPFVELSTNFYNRVYNDEEEWFRSIFAGSKKEDAIRNQYEFFVQRMGGPPLYSQRKGHPALIGRHRPFPVTHQAAERWLHHMQQALDITPSIDADSKIKMMNFFRLKTSGVISVNTTNSGCQACKYVRIVWHTAFFLVAGNEVTRQAK